MKKYFFPILLSFLTIGIVSVHAQSTLVTCDGASCTWPKMFEIMRNIISLGLGIAILYAFVRIALLGAQYGLQSDQAEIRTKFRNNSLVILISAIALVALLPFTSYVLKTLKADTKVTNPIDCLQKANSPGCPKPSNNLDANRPSALR